MPKLGKLVGSVLGSALTTMDKVNGAMGGVLGVMLLLLTGLISYSVFMRYVLNSPVDFTEDVAMTVQVSLASIGVGYVLKREGHVTVDFLSERLKPKGQAILDFISSIIGVFGCAVLALIMWLNFMDAFSLHLATRTMMWPIWPMKLLLFAGMCLFGLQFIARAHKYYRMAKGEAVETEEVGHYV